MWERVNKDKKSDWIFPSTSSGNLWLNLSCFFQLQLSHYHPKALTLKSHFLYPLQFNSMQKKLCKWICTIQPKEVQISFFFSVSSLDKKRRGGHCDEVGRRWARKWVIVPFQSKLRVGHFDKTFQSKSF